jgi:hypothetical protein
MERQEGGSLTPLCAGGTLARSHAIDHPQNGRRVRLLSEIGVLFVLVPLAIWQAIVIWRVPLPLVLQPVLIGLVAYLLWDKTFKLKRELAAGIQRTTLVRILATFALIGTAVTLWAWIELPHRFLHLPLNVPVVWIAVMILYPLLSVIPQELVYRTFFFHRYGPLFGDARWLAILVNGALFGFAHIIFGNVISIVLSTVLGILLAWRYDATRSFWTIWLEHSLYGCLIFTVGLGQYFFTGASTLR